MMPVMQHPAQDKETQQKLAELEKKTGKKPNVVVFLLDDVGWMDVGFNGGGVAVGNPTPDIDAVASQGLILTSANLTEALPQPAPPFSPDNTPSTTAF